MVVDLVRRVASVQPWIRNIQAERIVDSLIVIGLPGQERNYERRATME